MLYQPMQVKLLLEEISVKISRKWWRRKCFDTTVTAAKSDWFDVRSFVNGKPIGVQYYATNHGRIVESDAMVQMLSFHHQCVFLIRYLTICVLRYSVFEEAGATHSVRCVQEQQNAKERVSFSSSKV